MTCKYEWWVCHSKSQRNPQKTPTETPASRGGTQTPSPSVNKTFYCRKEGHLFYSHITPESGVDDGIQFIHQVAHSKPLYVVLCFSVRSCKQWLTPIYSGGKHNVGAEWLRRTGKLLSWVPTFIFLLLNLHTQMCIHTEEVLQTLDHHGGSYSKSRG